MPFGIRKAKLTGIVLAFIILLSTFILLFASSRKLASHSNSLNHTQMVIQNLEALNKETNMLENRFRNYMATRRSDVKNDYDIIKGSLHDDYHSLKELVKDNSSQTILADSAEKLTESRIRFHHSIFDTGIIVSPAEITLDKFYQVVHFDGRPGSITDSLIAKMDWEERQLLKKRTERFNSFTNYVNTIYLTCFLLALFVGIYSIRVFLDESKERERALRRSESYREELERRYTELEEKNQQIVDLKAQEKFSATGRIARTIAHEVRNPLTNINLATEQIKEAFAPDDDNQLMVDMVKRNSLRINELICNLLNATRYLDLKFQACSAQQLLNECIQQSADRMQLKNIEVVRNFPLQPCFVYADPEKLKIAFVNIIVNAAEAMNTGKGILKISLKDNNGFCSISFEDNGEGMSNETLSKLFEPFYTSKEKGNGLGLTNTQNIILNHKGKLHVFSTEGKGSTFVITLEKPKEPANT